jgi:CheY-like chemotaxis protein
MNMNYPKCILLIDDDEDERDIFFTALHECFQDIELLYEKDGHAAMMRLCNEQIPAPEMVFLDWRMPMVTGKDVLATIRQLRHYNSIPVVIFAGSLTPIDRQEATALGASYFLNKQPGIKELCQKLERLFSRDWKQAPSVTESI